MDNAAFDRHVFISDGYGNNSEARDTQVMLQFPVQLRDDYAAVCRNESVETAIRIKIDQFTRRCPLVILLSLPEIRYHCGRILPGYRSGMVPQQEMKWIDSGCSSYPTLNPK